MGGLLVTAGLVAACGTAKPATLDASCVGAACAPTGDNSSTSTPAPIPQGVAPLGVFFDATTIAGLAGNDFLSAHVAWSFGDTEAGAYGTTNKDKNVATGFVAGHVFERPGSYQVKAVIVDRDGATLAVPPVTITVGSFMGETRCLSVSGSFTDAPEGFLSATGDDLAAQLAWLGGSSTSAPRRLLLRRGESWSLAASSFRVAGTGGILAAFGSGAKPRIVGAQSLINFAGKDMRVSDIDLEGGMDMTGTGIVALRLDVHGARSSPDVNNGSGVGMGGDQLFLADSTVLNNGYFSVYADGSRISITGNAIDQLRIATSFRRADPQTSRDIFVTNNLIDASRTQPTTAIKWHSRRGVITDNILLAGTYRISLGTDDNQTFVPKIDEGLGTVLIERNVMRTPSRNPDNDRYTYCGFEVIGNSHVVVRNNLFYDLSQAFCDVGHNPRFSASDVAFYNNSIYKLKGYLNHDEGDFVFLDGNIKGLRVANNIMYTNNEATAEPVILLFSVPLASIEDTHIANNLYFSVKPKGSRFASYDVASAAAYSFHSFEDWQARGYDAGSRILDPRFKSVDPKAGGFLELEADSPAVGMGAAVPVYFDAKLRRRDPAIDIGAFEFVP